MLAHDWLSERKKVAQVFLLNCPMRVCDSCEFNDCLPSDFIVTLVCGTVFTA